MAYGFGKPTDWDTILVFDLGGGTLDLSLLEAFEGIMEVSTGTLHREAPLVGSRCMFI